MRVHKLTLAALAVAAGLSLTACQNDDGTAQSAPPTAATAASSNGGTGSDGSGRGGGGTDSAGKSPDGRGTAAGTGSGGADEDGRAGKAGKCRTDELEITAMDATIDGDREGTVTVDLRNAGGRGCTLAGYAGVDLKTEAGPLSAKRTGAQAPSGTGRP